MDRRGSSADRRAGGLAGRQTGGQQPASVESSGRQTGGLGRQEVGADMAIIVGRRTSLRGALRAFHPGLSDVVGLVLLYFLPQLISSASTMMLIAGASSSHGAASQRRLCGFVLKN